MTQYSVTLRGTLVLAAETGDRETVIDAAFDRAMAEMLELSELIDPGFGGSIVTGEIELSAIIEAEDRGAANAKVLAAVRTALHAAEIGTQEWDLAPQRINIESLDAELITA